MTNALDEIMAALREAAPEVAEQFEREYADPVLTPVDGPPELRDTAVLCERCGSLVLDSPARSGVGEHVLWHRQLSLRLFATAGAVKHLLERVGELDASLERAFSEMRGEPL